MGQMFKPPVETNGLTARFEALIRDHDFPCVGAKSALARHQMHTCLAGDLRCPADDARIFAQLAQFAADYHANPGLFYSLAVLFPLTTPLSEADFEAALWTRVQALSDCDAQAGFAYDTRVSSDADNPHFSLSFGGEAFFLIGLHPNASRPARRFEVPVLVFNPHGQFEALRQAQRYEALRASIIARDVALAGTPNPMLATHGDVSEARQYSGRVVDDHWACPFQAHNPGHENDRS